MTLDEREGDRPALPGTDGPSRSSSGTPARGDGAAPKLVDVSAIYAAADELGDRIAAMEAPTGRLLVTAECTRRMRERAALHLRNDREARLAHDASERLWGLLMEARP